VKKVDGETDGKRSKWSNLIILGSTRGFSSCNLVRIMVLICTSQFKN